MNDFEIVKRALEICTLEPDAMFAKHYEEMRNAAISLCNIRNRLVLVETLLENVVIASKLKNGNDDLDRTIEAAAYYILAGEEKEGHDGNKTTD